MRHQGLAIKKRKRNNTTEAHLALPEEQQRDLDEQINQLKRPKTPEPPEYEYLPRRVPEEIPMYLSLATSLRIVFATCLTHEQVERARDLMTFFLTEYQRVRDYYGLLIIPIKPSLQIYGKDALKPNFHWATHQFEQLYNFGSMSNFWCFLPERLNGVLKSVNSNYWKHGVMESTFMHGFLADSAVLRIVHILCICFCHEFTDPLSQMRHIQLEHADYKMRLTQEEQKESQALHELMTELLTSSLTSRGTVDSLGDAQEIVRDECRSFPVTTCDYTNMYIALIGSQRFLSQGSSFVLNATQEEQLCKYYEHLGIKVLPSSAQYKSGYKYIKKSATPYGAAIIQGRRLTPVPRNKGKASSGLVKIAVEDCVSNSITYKYGELINLISHQHEGRDRQFAEVQYFKTLDTNVFSEDWWKDL